MKKFILFVLHVCLLNQFSSAQTREQIASDPQLQDKRELGLGAYNKHTRQRMIRLYRLGVFSDLDAKRLKKEHRKIMNDTLELVAEGKGTEELKAKNRKQLDQLNDKINQLVNKKLPEKKVEKKVTKTNDIDSEPTYADPYSYGMSYGYGGLYR